MEITTKWNYRLESPRSFVMVHTSDLEAIQARYVKYDDATDNDKPGFYCIDIDTKGGSITVYADHEQMASLLSLQQNNTPSPLATT